MTVLASYKFSLVIQLPLKQNKCISIVVPLSVCVSVCIGIDYRVRFLVGNQMVELDYNVTLTIRKT